MGKIFLLITIFLISVFLSFFRPSYVVCQSLDVELGEHKYLSSKPEKAELVKGKIGYVDKRYNFRPDKEVRYVAGKDKQWFTGDDEVYYYYIPEFDADGNMVGKKCYIPGPDKIAFTSDDQLQNYFVNEYNKDNSPGKEIFYTLKEPNKTTFGYYGLYEDNPDGTKKLLKRYNSNGEMISYVIYEYNPQGQIVKDIEYKGRGADDKWFTGDDEIEKYQRREYGEDGNLLRAMEYHVAHEGKGPDGKWFTPDDVISSTRVVFWDSDGHVSKMEKSIDKGPDGKWFTEDDVLQYYTLFYYASCKES